MPLKDAMDQMMKTLLRKKTMSLITSPERRASFLRKIETKPMEKKEYLKGKSIIYR
jgi:hypothetical protein